MSQVLNRANRKFWASQDGIEEVVSKVCESSKVERTKTQNHGFLWFDHGNSRLILSY
jgi:hypothetical protein